MDQSVESEDQILEGPGEWSGQMGESYYWNKYNIGIRTPDGGGYQVPIPLLHVDPANLTREDIEAYLIRFVSYI